MILDSFKDWITQSADIYGKTTTYNDATGEAVEGWEALQTGLSVAVYFGAASNSLVSERFKGNVDGVMIVDPRNVTITLDGTQRATIAGVEYYMLEPDNVLGLDEVISVPLSKEGL